MLILSDLMLNRTEEENQYTIFPFIHQRVNIYQKKDQLRFINIPDVISNKVIPKTKPNFSMCAGDFNEIYQKEVDKWDCIITCFFIDTGKNVIDYLQTIYKCLKPGGIWINFGPLVKKLKKLKKKKN
jgi:carnosine N-methyltransferase